MGYYEIVKKYKGFDFEGYFDKVTDQDILKSLSKDKLNEYDFLNILSDRALKYIEKMANKAMHLTVQYFGKTISLYTPIYISNYCTNRCLYCGFNKDNKISREKLNLEEVEKEAQEIAKTGIKHILVLTGEAEEIAGFDYLKESVKIISKYFPSVSIEVFPMDTDKYKELQAIGVDGMTVYQETYDELLYDKVHLSGKKKDYHYRIDTPERGAMAGFRQVNMGTLFGLGETQREAFFSGMHAKYLMDKYLDTEFSLSLPRINEAEGGFQPYYKVTNKKFVQIMTAYRIFLHKAGINVSTREMPEFRDNILKLGVTRMSAGSRTDVGGYSKIKKSTKQFEISDNRNVQETVMMIKSQNYQPVYKDWLWQGSISK